VLRKEDFGARIRNARVVGSAKAYEEDVKIGATQVKNEDDDVSMDNDEAQSKLCHLSSFYFNSTLVTPYF
jgi:hypothetical protein